VDIFNFAPHSLNKNLVSDLYVNTFCSNGNSWEINYHGKLLKNSFISLSKNKIQNTYSESHFICLSQEKNINEEYLLNSFKLEKKFHPPMRSNIKIYNKYTAASYQGEIPAIFLNNNLSLVSCSPMIQKEDSVKNYFYLVNLSNSPQIKEFNVEVLSLNKEKILDIKCMTNSVNFYDLEELKNLDEKVFIFKSENYGGIPLYFSTNESNTSMSIEHTHPPTEQVIYGDRSYFQKLKKNYWFKKNK
tara:strand:- start:165 stop:899 length:735 start_codon:yes stop_codon:yes gene_type:complete